MQKAANEARIRQIERRGALDLPAFPAADLCTMPAATQTLLDDGYARIDAWSADGVAASFSMQETQRS